jgi:hypothetical protein
MHRKIRARVQQRGDDGEHHLSGVSAAYAVSLVVIIHLAHADCGDALVQNFTRDHVKRLRNAKDDLHLPVAANKRLKAIRAVFRWAMEENEFKDLINDDPTLRVKFVPTNSDGYHTYCFEMLNKK